MSCRSLISAARTLSCSIPLSMGSKTAGIANVVAAADGSSHEGATTAPGAAVTTLFTAVDAAPARRTDGSREAPSTSIEGSQMKMKDTAPR